MPMTELFPYLVLAIVLALVSRSMIGLGGIAARSTHLRPTTVSLLTYAPVAAFAVWVASLLWRMAMQGGGYSLWPFELAVAVVFWLTWIAIVAFVVMLHEQVLRLFRRASRPEEAQDA
jgi:hypothetical protein